MKCLINNTDNQSIYYQIWYSTHLTPATIQLPDMDFVAPSTLNFVVL